MTLKLNVAFNSEYQWSFSEYFLKMVSQLTLTSVFKTYFISRYVYVYNESKQQFN